VAKGGDPNSNVRLSVADRYPDWRRAGRHGGDTERGEQTGHLPGEVPAGGVTIG